ncbi:unnamed protein product [Rotaria magnacalcarata]|uniref:Uncharacterized protein n=1 Tax=Rotaria magnacalcarata TaxID=392030 RepID=A0A816SZX2_9BILA|nr:unnamed protein product [Rotaria magnacalcarata]
MLAGILVDVSGSMKNSLQLHVQPTDQDVTRAQSIFTTIMNIVDREVDFRHNHEVFVLAFGLQDIATCDLLALLDYIQTIDLKSDDEGHENLIQLLKNNGARYAGKYVRKYVPKRQAQFRFKFYSQNENRHMLTDIVQRLPRVCKEDDLLSYAQNGSFFIMNLNPLEPPGAGAGDMMEESKTKEQIEHAINYAKDIIRQRSLKRLRTMETPRTDSNWTQAQRQMFELSSTVENCHSAMSILLEQGWELPADGHSRLFLQANHPDVIKEFSNLMNYISDHDDVLLNMVGRVSLDMYINAANSSFSVKEQSGCTCYAHAVATVFHLAMRRIEGRENGVPDFADICHKLINKFGERGAITEKVLNIYAPEYRLHYREVDEIGARQAINQRRPVVATFLLPSEIRAFQRKSSEKGRNLIEKLPPGIQNIPYECPHCRQCSAVRAFIIHFSDAECPTCHRHFKPTPLGLNVTAYTH